MKYYLQTYTPRVKIFYSIDDPMNYKVIIDGTNETDPHGPFPITPE
jgi:hypothetical protein